MGRDEVDFLVVDAILGSYGDREQEDPEDVFVVGIDPRAWLIRVLVRREQRRQRRCMDRVGQMTHQLVFSGVDEFDPARGVTVHRRRS